MTWWVPVSPNDRADLDDLFPDYLVECDEHLTTVRPIGNRLPDRGTQLTRTRPSTASLDVTV